MVDLGREAGQALSRGDYLALAAAGLNSADRIVAASDDQILACVENNKERLQAVRDAARKMKLRAEGDVTPALAPYAA